MQKAWGFLRDPKMSLFVGFSLVACPMLMVIGAPVTTWLYRVHNGDFSKGTPETQSNYHRCWHDMEVVGSEEREGKTADMICKLSGNPA